MDTGVIALHDLQIIRGVFPREMPIKDHIPTFCNAELMKTLNSGHATLLFHLISFILISDAFTYRKQVFYLCFFGYL